MRSRKIGRVYELREYGDQNYLLSVECWEPFYNGAEGFWVSDTMDWILYASHESSVTTGGWLTDAVFSAWNDARSCKWSMYQAPKSP